jgi:hypothetical protein
MRAAGVTPARAVGATKRVELALELGRHPNVV